MRKIIAFMIVSLMLNFISITTVFANRAVDATLITNTTELKNANQVEVTLRFDYFKDVEKGINAYKATLEYDKSIFEEVTASNFSCQGDWEELKYNPANGEFVAIRKARSLTGGDIVKITLQVKKDVDATKTIVKVKDIMASEGKGDILLADSSLIFNIIKEQIDVPTNPSVPEKPSTGDNTSTTVENKPSASGNVVGSIVGHLPKPGTSSTDKDNSQNVDNQEESEKPNGSGNASDSNVEKPNTGSLDEPTDQTKITKTTKTYKKLFIFVLFQVILATVVIIYCKRNMGEEEDKNGNNKYMMIILTGILFTEFMGVTCALARSFTKKGELNGDGVVNYADASLLELHLVDLKKLPMDKLENADMNSDGMLTVTDLSLLIQKLENLLEFDVIINNLEVDNYYPNKNENIQVTFNGDVSYGVDIQKLVINGTEYELEKKQNGEYYFTLSVDDKTGVKTYKITEALLENGKSVKIDYSIDVDVLKDVPSISNYRVEEDKENAKLSILFNVMDVDASLRLATIEIYDEDQTLKTKQNLKRGENRIEIEVEDAKEYKAYITLDYDLDSNQLENDEEHVGTQKYEKELQLILNYNFSISNIKTYKDGTETTLFNKGDQVQLVFESKNDTKYIPSFIKVNGKEYEVLEENNKYVSTLDALENLGSYTITIEEVALSNGKKFEVKDNNVLTIQVNKRKPSISNLATAEFTETNNIRVMFGLEDEDKAITGISIVLMDADEQEIDRSVLTGEQFKNMDEVNVYLNTKLTSKYKLKVYMSYNLTGNALDDVVDELVKEQEIKADPQVKIKSVKSSKDYVEKGDTLKLTFDFESNKKEDIVRILINNINCIAVKLENGNYEATLNVGNTSGIYPLNITQLTYSDGVVATLYSTVNVDVLKDKPEVIHFTQSDNLLTREVSLGFDIKDDENSFISGKALLTLDGTTIEKEIHRGYNELTFQVESARKYTLEIKATYDLDSNALQGKPVEENRIIDGVIATREISLIADYQLNIANIKTYNEQGETKYFGKSEPIKISFESTNVTDFEPVKAIINGTEYNLTKKDNAYYLTISSHRTSGVKTAKIEKIVLSNSKELTLNKDNEIKVTVLKDKPTVEGFGYKENADATISATFNVVDGEEAITGGKVIVLKNGNSVKEQALEKDQNTITFQPEENQNYVVKVIADYDLDMNVLEEDANEYKNITLLEADVTLGKRKFEVKDIIRTLLYKQTGNGVEEVQNLKASDLSNLDNYIIKVRTREMPAFYTTISGYRIENNKLILTLDYDNVVQYTDNNDKQNKLEVVYGEIINDVATNISLESLLREMELNPTGTFILDRDYDASIIANNNSALVTTSFMGTLNGNGHKIYNLPKPLFDSIESATIENLILESPELSGPTSRGTIANIATNSTVRNVQINNLSLTTGANASAGIIGEGTNVTVEQSSVKNFTITTTGHIRVSAIIGQLTGGTIRNCYVEGSINSTQTKDGNGIGGILGHGFATEIIENCIVKVNFTSNVTPRLNGGVVGLFMKKDSVLRNNVSLSTGNGFYSIHGNEPTSTSSNNYELLDSGLTSNASSDRVKQVSQEDITSEFFRDSAHFDEDIWDLSNASYTNPPVLKIGKQNTGSTTKEEMPSNDKLYIPDYSRIKKINGYTKSKDILYHNINKLMPYYDAKYLVEDGLKIANDHELNTKIIKHTLPYSNGKLVTYLTSQNYNSITSIKVIFDDYTVSEYNVKFKELSQNISIYEIENLNIDYAYNNYVIKEESSIVKTIVDYINSVDYATKLEPLTEAADARHYRDHYNETIKSLAQMIALQLLQNDADSVLTINNEILNNRIKQQLIDSGRLDKILYGYNYYYRWYSFDIKGTKVSDLLLFEGKMFKDSMTLDNVVNETLVGNIVPNNTAIFYINNLSKYTGSSTIQYFLDYVISRIGGYGDVNDWFTEYFGSRNFLAEFGVDNRPELLYRGWYQLKKNSRMILPVITMPSYSTYMISGPAHLQFGPAQLYNKDTVTEAGQKVVRNIINNHVTLAKRHFTVMAGGFGSLKWNNYCIMVYDSTRIITGYRESYITIGGNKIPTGKIVPVYTQGRVGQNYAFFKNFSEVLGLWQPAGSSGGVGSTAGFLWFQAQPGLTNYETWTHEFEHALLDKIMLNQSGFRTKLEDMTQGNLEQRESWSENNLNQDVGPYYFNTSFYLNKEGNATQNLSPDRIDTKEEMENYFKGQQNALDLLDYIEGKAFIRLNSEQQAKIATSVISTAGRTTWGTITAEQARQMDLTSLESLYDNQIILRPPNAWGASVRGLTMPDTTIADNYGYESVWVNRWYIDHYDGGYSGAFAIKRNFFEMLGYAGVEGYVIYGSRRSSSDLDAIQKITQLVTGTAMNWREYKMSRYATVEESLKNNKYIDADYMIERFTEALTNDANRGDRNVSQRTNLRKIYYHYLKSVTNDFIDDPLGTTTEVNHIKTAEELVQKMNAKPYGYYVLDNDIDFSNMTKNVTQTFMGKLDGKGHKIIGNKMPIFNKIRYGYVGNIVFENTNIPKNINNAGALSYRAEMSTVENIQTVNLQMNFGGRNDISLISGAVSNLITRNCTVEKLTYHISTIEDFVKINDDSSGIYILDNDIDFTGKTYTDSVITSQFTGKIDGQGHTLSNLSGVSLFNVFNGTVENLNISNVTIQSTNDNIAVFAKQSTGATFKNMKFTNITLSGANNIGTVVAVANQGSTFEKISVKNLDITLTGMFAGGIAGAQYGGKVSNVYVEGSIHLSHIGAGGIIGATGNQSNVTINNAIAKVDINRTADTDNQHRKNNAGLVGFVADTSKLASISNSIAFGNMVGFNADMIPNKFINTTENIIITKLTKCYEFTEATGGSSVTDATTGHLDVVTRDNLNTDFYKLLGFSEEIWNLDSIPDKGYPELK